MPSGRQANISQMSPSRSATAVTRAAPASSRRALSCMPSSQRRLCLSQGGACFDALPPPDRSITCAAARPRSAPASASTAIVAWPTTPVPPPLSRKLVVSCIASTCRPATRPAVPRAAFSTTFSTVTFPFRRNRPMRTSPARVPPTLHTEMPRGPRLTGRSCRNRPASSTRRSPKCEASLSMSDPPGSRQLRGTGESQDTDKRKPPFNTLQGRRVHTVGSQSGAGSGGPIPFRTAAAGANGQGWTPDQVRGDGLGHDGNRFQRNSLGRPCLSGGGGGGRLARVPA